MSSLASRFLEISLVGFGGACGSVLRYLVSVVLSSGQRWMPTLAVNLIGCFVIGIVAALIAGLNLRQWVCLLLITGLLGGFTTYSAFGLDAFRLFRDGHIYQAIIYVTVTLVGAIVLCSAGYLLTEKLVNLVHS